ncbi:MAG: non-canonical purine NTP pyrophosphatase, RdgB/HAM1 family [Thermoprotei archaeon]|nr:MAG: non-canonical purine NTP pyrophosphatase, RdgB/HAM1 family [Thermoprotei archaeon]
MSDSVQIYFVTNNTHKYLEVKIIAEKYGFKLIQLTGEKIEIQSNDLGKIAKISALNAFAKLEKPVLVEDAGLFIKAFRGFPGPYSSYVFKTIGCQGILKLLDGVLDRCAWFKSVSVLIYEPFILTGEGIVEGIISTEPRGSRGFGFDPIFIPKGATKTFAEMDIEEKNKFSHRAKSVESVFSRLIKYLRTLG